MNQRAARLWALLLALSLLLSLAACGYGTAAATMHLVRTEGRVAVSDGDGEDVPLQDNLGLYSGYGVDTRSESYAWIDLDDTKLIKMDQKSKIVMEKDEKDLEIAVKSGSLFFHVPEPLADDETMDIRTSTMIVGIRGACGWVEYQDGLSRVCLLEGTAECSTRGKTVQVNAGETAVLPADGELTVTALTARNIPDFVMEELEGDDDLVQAILEASGIDVMNPADPVADALEQYRIIAGQADTYFEYMDYYSEASISYLYALVRMQPGDTVPTLLIEQNVEHNFYGYFGYVRVFQYDPESGSVRQPPDVLMEGVAGAGGYRGSLSMMGDGNGIEAMEWSSGSGETYISRVTLEGNSLLWTTVWTGRIDLIPDEISSTAIDWCDISDMSALESWASDANTPALWPEPAQPSGSDTLPTDGNRIVFTGTINSYTYDELLALQGMEDPNPGSYEYEIGNIYWLIVLDTPQPMALKHASGSEGYQEHTASIIGVFADGLDRYDGQHLIFSIDPDRTWWPSDVSAPFGEPRTDDIHVLGTAP